MPHFVELFGGRRVAGVYFPVDGVHLVQGVFIALGQQGFFVGEVVVKSPFGYLQVFGNFIQGCAVKALAIEKTRAGLEKSFLLEPVLGLTIKTLGR